MIVLKVLLMIIFYIILILLGLLFILLISPIKGAVWFDTSGILFKGSYLFGLLRIEYNKKLKLRFFGFKIQVSDDEKTDEKEDNQKEEKKEKKKGRSLKRPSLEIVHLTLDLVKKLISIIAPKEASLHLTLGLDDPYYTQMMHIISMVLFIPLNRKKNYDFQLNPILDDIAIDFKGHAKISFSLMQLILPVARFLIRKPIRNYLNIRLFKRKP
ncbi:hypothetical protein EZV73_06605 [Acidaminobacter sp. JC074]|uniref:hypothetical protein n=1 Tax=Acidaminobacter sp. JC074 TaxID=2530199 RepID=UPI001F0D9BCF|nr:hypothetical protein [Acidaminobacter sp. JC074]MCH4887233.1 hypothetical protein [Acidaminobacter sp. JC074]